MHVRPILAALAAAAALLVTGTTSALAAPAGGVNFGACVSRGLVNPSTDPFGPFRFNANTPTGFTGALNAHAQSGGNSRFADAIICTRPPHP